MGGCAKKIFFIIFHKMAYRFLIFNYQLISIIMDAYDIWLDGVKERIKVIQDEYLDNYSKDKEGSTNMLKVLGALIENLES
jgi:hypothetical protein